MMEAAVVRVAVVGYGWWGRTIARTLAASAAVRVVLVVEPDDAARAAARADGAAAGFAVAGRFEEALATAAVDAVVLCTPHKAHAAQIAAAAAAGKHVFCEKPLCLSYADAVAAVGACRAAGVVLGIGHERRFEPAVVALRERIARGELGAILQIEANFSQDKFFALPPDNWRLSVAHAPVGPLSATGIHLVDLAIAVLGPAESVWARLATRGSHFANGDTLGVMLGFPGGANALVSAMLATPFEGRFAVYGSHGWVEIRDRTHPENPTGWDVTTCLRGAPRTTAFVAPHASVRANLEAFAAAVRGAAPYPVTSREMLANVAALEAIMRSAGSGRVEAVAQPGD
ncbi:MAG: Gfo/Idh/MocA family oxidoreductase [Burkholderiales bacterium]|nr:Gfo/Idh/MocA family oxidoreductase [Burkholderiales bacterium]